MKMIRKNIIFIILFLGMALCIIKRNNYLPMPVVSHPDSQITFSTKQSVLEQTWQPQIKKIAGVNIPYTATADFGSNLELSIYTDDCSELLAQTSIYQEFKKDDTGILEFAFKAFRVIPGERYRIQLRYAEPSTEGTLLITSGSNYGGCSIDETACNEAAAFEIIYVKNSRLFWLLAVFFPFLSFSLLFMVVWNRKWEECVGLSLIGTVFILYVAGLFEILAVGMAIVYILAAAGLFVSIYLYNKKGMQIMDLFSPALVVYAGLFLLILINCRNSWFARWDEYTHWGLAVKDMFFYDSLAKHVNTSVMLPRYLPFSTLIEYLFVYANGLFSQELVYVAYQTIILSSLIIICRVAIKKWRYLIPSTAIMVLMPVIFFRDVYNCIYVDPLLAVFMAYVLICYFSEKMSGFNLLRILGGLFALIATKDMGVVIAGLLAVVMLADRLYHMIRQKKIKIKELICPCLCVLFVIGIFMSWQVYMGIPAKAAVSKPQISEEIQSAEENNQEVSFDNAINASGISMGEVWKLLRGEADEYKYQSMKNYLVAIFDEEAYWFGNIGFSYMDLYILMLALIGVLLLIRFWGEEASKILSFGIFTFLFGICYCIVLEVMYLFAFPSYEAVYLSSYIRYLGSYLGGFIIAFACLIVWRAAEYEKKEKVHSRIVLLGVTAALLICVPMEGFVTKNMDIEVTEDDIYGFEDMAEVLRSFSVKAENIYFVSNNSGDVYYYIFRNAVSPLLTPYTQNNIYVSKDAYLKQADIWAQNQEEIKNAGYVIVSCEEWEKKIQDCQYVFLLHPGEVFKESYGGLFEDPDTIDDGTFYQVQQNDTNVMLSYIGKVGVKSYK